MSKTGDGPLGTLSVRLFDETIPSVPLQRRTLGDEALRILVSVVVLTKNYGLYPV